MNIPEHVTDCFIEAIKLPSSNGKQLNYLFVMPQTVSNDDTAYVIPYGLCLVSSSLKASGRNVSTLNMNYKTSPDGLLQEIIENKSIDILFTGGTSPQYAAIRKIIEVAKNFCPDIVTCVGGGIITAEPKVAMDALELADYGIVGEGEITINEFAYSLENDMDMKQVDGMVLKDGTITNPRAPIKNLDILPFPDYDGFEYDMLLRDGLYPDLGKDARLAQLYISRSCPYNCTFCFQTTGRKYRKRSIENVIKEIDWLISKFGINYISFGDEMFAKDMVYVKGIADHLKRCNVKYTIMSRVDSVSREALQIFKDSGCYNIFFGVESADNHILKSMRKNITVEQIEKTFSLALEIGLFATGNIILGDAEETAETIGNSLNWWKNHPEFNLRIFWILTFPGSNLYKLACMRGVIPNPVEYLRNNSTQINVTKMTDDQYWSLANKVMLFQVLSVSGIDVEFENIDCYINIIKNNLEGILLTNKKIVIWPIMLDIAKMMDFISSEFFTSDKVFLVNANPINSLVLGVESFAKKKVYTPDEIFANSDVDLVLYAYGNLHPNSEGVFNRINELIKTQYISVKRFVTLADLGGITG